MQVEIKLKEEKFVRIYKEVNLSIFVKPLYPDDTKPFVRVTDDIMAPSLLEVNLDDIQYAHCEGK